MRLILVASDTSSRNELAKLLRSGGHLVLAVESAGSAVATIASLGCPDVAVIDANLPPGDPATVLNEARRHLCPRSPGAVIVNAEPDQGLDSIDLAEHDLCLPPERLDQLLEAVAEAHHAALHGDTADIERRCRQGDRPGQPA